MLSPRAPNISHTAHFFKKDQRVLTASRFEFFGMGKNIYCDTGIVTASVCVCFLTVAASAWTE